MSDQEDEFFDAVEISIMNNKVTDILNSGKKFSWITRSSLPSKMVKSDFSIWSFLKQCIGKELSKITMPIELNEPLSFLQRIAEYMEYSDLLQEAAKEADPIKRMELVCAFAVSATSSNFNRMGKPFNPLLGETYELHHHGFVFVAEQVSHHPPITAFHVESDGYRMYASIQPKIRFWGKSVDIQPKGLVTLELHKTDEIFTWKNVNLVVHNVLIGKLWLEHAGTLRVVNQKTGCVAELEFQPASWFGHTSHRVTGNLLSRSPSSSPSDTPVAERVLFGNWVRGLFSVDPRSWEARVELSSTVISGQTPNMQDAIDTNDGQPAFMPSDATSVDNVDSEPEYGFEIPLPNQRCLWRVRLRPRDAVDAYNFTSYAVGLNDLPEELAKAECIIDASSGQKTSYLPPTDSRYRPDIRLLERGNVGGAADEKHRLEEKQRRVRQLRASSVAMQRQSTSAGSPVRRTTSLVMRHTSSHSSEEGSLGGGGSTKKSFPSLTSGLERTIVGPVWFNLQPNRYTKEQDWFFTNEYWQRNWSLCPDLY